MDNDDEDDEEDDEDEDDEEEVSVYFLKIPIFKPSSNLSDRVDHVNARVEIQEIIISM